MSVKITEIAVMTEVKSELQIEWFNYISNVSYVMLCVFCVIFTW